MWPIRLHDISYQKFFFEISQDMVQTLLMLEILFIQIEGLFCGVLPALNPACFSANIFWLGNDYSKNDYSSAYSK